MESCLVSLVWECGRTSVQCISKLSSLLNRPPNSKFILLMTPLGRHLGNEQAVILVWLPVTMNGFPFHIVKNLSRYVHARQQHLQTQICGRHFCTKTESRFGCRTRKLMAHNKNNVFATAGSYRHFSIKLACKTGHPTGFLFSQERI